MIITLIQVIASRRSITLDEWMALRIMHGMGTLGIYTVSYVTRTQYLYF